MVSCCSCRFAGRLAVYLFVGTACNVLNMWSWLYEPHGSMCKHQPLGGNNSGVKVLVYGMAKTGTTTAVRALYDVGLNAYHNEEWNFHVWSPLMDEYFYRPENGGKVFGWARLATPWGPAWKGHAFWMRTKNGTDLRLLREIEHEELAAATSRCRVDALSFDGLEPLFEKMLALSPDAKIVVLDWRTFDEYFKSLAFFSVFEWLLMFSLNFLVLPMHIFPWNMFLFPWLDPYFGDPIVDHMRNGRPFHRGTLNTNNAANPFVFLWRTQMFDRRIVQHQMNGFFNPITTKKEYEDYWKWIKERVPEENRFHFNLKKHGHKDLCKFLNIKGNPACELEGPIPYKGVSIINYERENSKWFAMEVAYLIPLHFLSYATFWALVGGISGWLHRWGVSLGLKSRQKKD